MTPMDGSDRSPPALPVITASPDRAVVRTTVWKLWEIHRGTVTTLVPSADPWFHRIGGTVDVFNREGNRRTWNPAVWSVPVHAAQMVVDPTIPKRIAL